MVTRTVTAECPAPIVEFDRSFAAAEPLCLVDYGNFQYSEGVYATVGVESVEEIAKLENCMKSVQGWIESEKQSRGIGADNE